MCLQSRRLHVFATHPYLPPLRHETTTFCKTIEQTDGIPKDRMVQYLTEDLELITTNMTSAGVDSAYVASISARLNRARDAVTDLAENHGQFLQIGFNDGLGKMATVVVGRVMRE